MPLKELIKQLCEEMNLDAPALNAQKEYPFALNPDLSIFMKSLDPGLTLHTNILPCPPQKREELFIYVMRANFLGQGTGGARIGLDADEKFLTLSHGFAYEMNYQTFKDRVEDFVNYTIYWREELTKKNLCRS